MTRAQLESQLDEMWDAVSHVSGPDGETAREQAQEAEAKLRKQFDDEERVRDAAPDLLEALEGILDIGKRDMSNPKYDTYFKSAKEAIRKARGL